VTQDDIRRLLGGYATGSLTDSERAALFEAALDDQELFEELAREQALKDLLDQPGAKQRLISALKPAPVASWKRKLIWSAATALIAAGIVAGWFATRPPGMVQEAHLQVAPAQVESDRRAAPPPGPAAPAPAPAASPIAASQPAPPFEKKLEKKSEKKKVAPDQEARKDVPTALKDDKAETVAVTAAPPLVIQNQVLPSSQGAQQQTAPQAFSAGAVMRAKSAARFGFDYQIEPGALLAITPAEPGFLSITADSTPIFPSTNNSRVPGGATIRIAFPPAAQTLTISFSAQSSAANQPIAQPIERDAQAGSVDDPNPSANSRLTVIVKIAH
jgi:hypothetical protein